MEHSLSLVFITSNGSKASITIQDVRDDLTNEDVKELMQVIIANDTFLTKNGALVTPYSAKKISKSSTVIEIE
ncbi:DUF2922 domain-containing protein [Clostridium intestinale]|jgi:hypothetical protein|uniref:DUF2922 domain-containing protein n=1 Tax=Clostridium intestinale TaxID=36845 RepID=A0A7D6ZYN6_9CLOT|nr:DUF2922 domain-containing protein [Clostridium intestinale]QLY78755.1 DUF2922 domain-containing protein [Clostridium intestinale]